jgi:preprotein translocase subunit YajC
MLKTLLALLPAASALAQESSNEFPVIPDTNFLQSIILLALMAAFLYFVIWRPEKRRRALLDMQRAALKAGDRVIAIGIVGTVETIKDRTVVLTMVDGSKIEVVKAAITEVQPRESAQ